MNLRKYFFFILIFVIFSICLSFSFANDLNESEVSTIDVDIDNDFHEISSCNCSEDAISSQDGENDEIIVNDWNDLQYYCSLKDKDYVLKLKENTNYYPADTKDSNYQIKINNNVKIIGSNGAYFGDISQNQDGLEYTAIVVPKSKIGITLQGITFNCISSHQVPFLKMSGEKTNLIKDCYFNNSESRLGSGTFINMDEGYTIFDNCTVINCSAEFGFISIYDGAGNHMYKTVHCIVKNSYFENNYGNVAPGCIYNSGLLDVYNSTFYRNRAYWWAGAIHTCRSGTTNIYNSFFYDNVAGWNGGALYTYSYLNIYNSSFIGNNCTTNNGGGVIGACKYISEPHIYVENSLFKDNENTCWELDELSTTGTGRGGAISLMDEGSIEVLNSTFIKNSASIGTAICAIEAGDYGSPDIIIKGNKFINNTRKGDVLVLRVDGTLLEVSDNYYFNNSIEFSSINLGVLSVGDESAKLKVFSVLKNPDNYDRDILDKTLFDVYVDGVYHKTVNSSVFDFDFGDLNICRVSVVPTIGNTRSNEVLLTSTREYIFVSKSTGSDDNIGLSRNAPVKSLLKAIQLARDCKNILIIDGEFSESNLNVDYDLTINGENNSTFVGNISNNMFNIVDSNLTLKNINIKNLNGNSVSFIKQSSGRLVLDRCKFSFNELTNIIDCQNLEMKDSKFINNFGSIKVSGNAEILNSIINNNKNAVIYKTTDSNLLITNSILLNNSDIVGGNKKNININNNWWGNTLNNFNVAPNSETNAWLFLNTEISNNILEYNQKSVVEYTFNLVKKDESILEYTNNLPNFDLNILTLNGVSSKNVVNFAGKSNKIIFTLTNTDDGVLTASYNGVSLLTTFKFVKSEPKISVSIVDVKYGDDAVIDVILSNPLTGNISLSLGNTTKTQLINGSKITFTISDLQAGEYPIVIKYSGDNIFNSSEINTKFRVNKFESSTIISVGEINVREDVHLNITVPDDATGNVTVIVNDINETIEITNAKVEYTINYVTRGDYFIKAIYNGDNKYLPSEADYSFEVDKLNSTINVTINDITYGEDALVEVKLNDNATGSVIVIIDGKSNSSHVKDGLSKIYLSGVDAGENKEVIIKYSGDSTYSKIIYNATFNVFKANISFSISAEDIKIGKDVIANINVPMGVKGNFTFIWDGGEVVKVIPVTGEVTCIISDLDIGNYTLRAIYNGNNYFTTENSTVFSVSEYPAPQWSNIGGNTRNTGKTDYEGDVNGNVKWTGFINSTVTGNMVIDSEGNVYVTTSSGIYSFDVDGVLRWIFNSNTFEGNYSGICIGRDVIVAPKSGDTLYFINQNDGTLYGNSNIYQGSSLFEPVIDKNANVYIASEYQTQSNSYNLVVVPFKIWEKGGSPILIQLLSKPVSAPVLINDDLVLMICENKISIIDISTLKTVINKNGNYSSTRAVVGDGGVIYMFLNDNIIALNTDGSQSWKTKVSGGVGDCLVLDNERCLYCVNSKGNLYSYDLFSGKESKFCDLLVDSGILIDNQGNLYFGSGEAFYCLDCDGNVLWKTMLSGRVVGSPIMDNKGIIYVTTFDNMIYALNSSSLKDPGLNVDSKDIYSGEDLIINITIDEDVSGYITVDFNGETFNVNANSFVKVISNLTKGNYTLKVYYSGDNKFKQDFKSMKVSVGKYKPHIIANCSDIEFGNVLNLKVFLDDDAEGNVSVNIGNANYTSILNNSQSVFTFPDLISGKYDINISYSGDGKYASGWIVKKVSVGVENISIDFVDVICYGSGKLTAILKDSNGKPITNASVNVNVGGNDYLLDSDLNGIVNLSNLQLGIGKYEVNVSFNGHDRYVSLVKSSVLAILSSIQVSDMVRGYNSGLDFQVAFVDCNGNKITSKINILIDGKSQPADIVDGKLLVNNKLSVGLHTISGVNPSTGESFSNIVKIIGRIGENKDCVVDYLDGSFYSVRIFGDDGNPVKAGVNVIVKINKKSYTVKTDSKGYAKLKITFTPGKYDVVVQYKSVKVKNTINVKQVIKAKNVNKKKSKFYKYSVSLKKSNGKAIKNKKVILKVKGKKYQGNTNKKGVVIFKIKQSLKKGKHTMKITYGKSTVKRILNIK